jgi:hypothetical protein
MERPSTAVTLNPAPQFHRFGKLPVELQLIIWGYATQNLESRIVKVGLKWETGYDTNYTYAAKYPIPALLHTCQGSRITTSKTYKPYFTEILQKRPVYICPEKDTLFVEGEYFMRSDEIESLLREVKEIQYLGFRVFYPCVLSLSFYITHLENLKELVLEWPDHDQYIPRDLVKVQFYHTWLRARFVGEGDEEEGEREIQEEEVEDGVEEEVVEAEEEGVEEVVEEEGFEEEGLEEEGVEEEEEEQGEVMEPFTITFLTDIESRAKFGKPFGKFGPFNLVRERGQGI